MSDTRAAPASVASRWRWLFILAAAFNIVIGLALIIVPDATYALAGTAPPSSLEPRLVGWFVAIFGYGYALVAANLTAHRGLIRMTAIGKFGAVVLVWSHWFAGSAPTAFALGVVGDLLFAVGFTLFLVRTKP